MTAASSLGAGVAIQACGGSSDTTGTPTAEAGPETTAPADAAPKDTSTPDVFDARPPCDPTKDILKDIPDASIADGASTTGECINCAKLNCMKEIQNCKKDCSRSTTDLGCQDLGAQALICYSMKQDFTMCIGGFASTKSATTQGIGVALGTCIGGHCKSECGVPDGG